MSTRIRDYSTALMLMFAAVTAQASELTLNNFAEGQTLITEGAHPLYQLTLPEQVYRSVAHPDLRDLRVFNAEGQAVPHTIKAPVTQRNIDEQKIALPLFPLTVDASTPSANWSLRIEVDGSLVSYAKTSPTGEAIQALTPTEWMIDLSKIEHPIHALNFQFTANSDSFTQKLHLTESSDLNQWHTLTDATLAHMQFANQKLTQDSVPLAQGRSRKYLRITALDPVSGFRIDKVSGTTRTEQHEQTVQTFELSAASSTQADQLEFDLGGSFRITALKLQLPVPNSLFNVSLYSRPSPNVDWHFREQGTVYRLGLNGEQITDKGFTLNHTDRYWQARFDANPSVQGQAPTLRVTWQPDELYFVAQGSAPFTLAYGNSQMTQQKPAVHALLNQLDADQKNTLIGHAQPGPTRTLQGSKALEVKTDIPWTRWLLWSLLGLGVVLAGRMAWKLKGEMVGR